MAAGGKRLLDTLRLLRSVMATVSGSRVVITSDVFYAARQHWGGVVRPRKAKMLAIPLTRAVARAVASAGSFRSAFPDAFVFTSKAGNILLSRKRADRKLDPIAVLKRSVRIPPTKFLGISEQGTQEMFAYINRMVLRAMEAA
jgi:phage gpG-like protein